MSNSFWPPGLHMPGFLVLHYFLEFAQTHVHWVRDAIQPSHYLSLPSPPALNLSPHQGLFQWVCSLHHVAKVLELQLQHQFLQWVFRVDFPLGLPSLISLLSKGLSRVFSSPGGSLFSSPDCLLAPKDLHPSRIKIYHPFPTSSKVSTYYNINLQSKISLHIYQFDSPKPLY